ncbi:MAG: hypothetical protein BRC43_05335 [Cyanobacteria bacterium QS_3_48_167]|nr:MAG: hypothetical protein BRC43_05335 [Cyanobacteria bacterium QS_3_48_167]
MPLSKQFTSGLLVVQDGSNETAVVSPDPEDKEIQNFNTNFKYVGLEPKLCLRLPGRNRQV